VRVGAYSALRQSTKRCKDHAERLSASSCLPILFMCLRDHVMNSKSFLYTDHYRKGTARRSEDREDREDNISDKWENESKEKEEKEATVEEEDTMRG